jgi:hypothetical protein
MTNSSTSKMKSATLLTEFIASNHIDSNKPLETDTITQFRALIENSYSAYTKNFTGQNQSSVVAPFQVLLTDLYQFNNYLEFGAHEEQTKVLTLQTQVHENVPTLQTKSSRKTLELLHRQIFKVQFHPLKRRQASQTIQPLSFRIFIIFRSLIHKVLSAKISSPATI